MRAIISRAKRCLSLLLAVLLVVPAMSLPAFAAEHDHAEGMLLSQVIVENYGDLSAAEKVILNSGVLAEDAAYPVIALPDDLITLDDENKMVWAEVVRTDGYIWMPDSVSIVVDGEEKEHIDTMTLNGDESAAFASYNYAGEKFTVEVGYKLFKDVEDAKELALLNVAYYLNQDISMAKTLTVKTEYATLGGLSMSVVDFLKTMTDETSGMALGLSGTIVDEIANLAANETLGAGMSAAAKQAALDLQSQKAAGLLLAKLFATLGSKSYLELLANGSLESALTDNYEDIAALAANDGLAAVSDALAGIIEEAEEARAEMYAAINDALDDVTYEGITFDAVNNKADIESALNKLNVEYQGILNTLNNQLETLGYTGKVESSADVGEGSAVSEYLSGRRAELQALIAAAAGAGNFGAVAQYSALLQVVGYAEAALETAKAGLAQLETAREGLEGALTVEENVETLYASKESVDMLVAAIQLLADKMAPAYNYEWNVDTTNKLIKSTDTATYKILTEAATRNDSYTKYTDSYVAGKELLLDTASSEYLMNVYSVTVNVVLQVTNAANGTDEYVQTSTVALANDTERDELAAQIDSLRADALSRQTAYIAAHYELAGTVGDMDAALDEGKLSDNVVYTYTYSPKEYTVSYGYAADDASVPYGYTLTLPNYAGGESLVYDYTVNGTEYKQGAKVQIVGNTEVDRTTGKPYTAKDLYDALASLFDSGADADAFLKAILTSGGVDLGIDNETMQVRVPEDSDNANGALVSRSDRTVTALPFASNYEGKQWKAASVLVYGANDQLLETVTQWNGNQAEIDSAAFERIEVVYELDLDYSSAAVQTALNRVVKVYNDARQQLNNMRKLSDQVGYFSLLTILEGLGLGEAAQEQYDFINENCTDEDGNYILKNHLDLYMADDYPLAYYYEHAEEITEQLLLLAGTSTDDSPIYIMLTDEAIVNTAEGMNYTAKQLEDIAISFLDLAAAMDATDENSTISNGEYVAAALQKLAGNTGFIVEVDNSGDEPKNVDVYPLQRDLWAAGAADEVEEAEADLALRSTLNLGGTENVKITVSIKFTGVTMDSSDDSVSVSVSKDIEVEEDIYAPILNSEVIELADLYAELVDGVRFTGGAGYEDLVDALAALVGTQLTENVTFTYVWEEHCMHPVTSDATCMIGEICETCGEEVTDPDPEAHAWNNGVITTEATCEADGVVTYTCKHNGEHTKTTSDEARVAAIGHSYTDYTFNNNATCEEDGTETAFCDNGCGSRNTRTKAGSALGHDFGSWVDNGDGHHIRYCGNANCSETEVEDHDWDWNSGVVTTNSTCTAEGVETFTCKHCDAETTKPIEKKPHNFTKWYYEAKGHVLTCADCGEWKDATLTSHSFGGSNCEIEYPCLDGCGYTKPRGEHLYGSNWTSKNGEEHYQTCQNSGCGKEVTEPHEFNKGVVTTPATCTEKGVMTYTCTAPGCGAFNTEDIPMVAHNYVGVVTIPATCTEDGEMTYTCSECGDFYTEVIDSDDGHKYRTTLKTPATCTEPGVVTYTCSACDDTYDVPDAVNYPATGHSYQGVVTTPADCEEPGVMTYTCSKCGDTYTEPIEPTGHSWDEGVVTTPADCDEPGIMTYTCQNNASHIKTEPIEAEGHNYKKADGVTDNLVDLKDGTHALVCTVCGEVDETTRASHIFHVEDCNESTFCACGAEKAAGDHVWVYTDNQDGGNDGNGTHSMECQYCDATDSENHKWNAGVVTTPATCTAEGVMTYTCTAGDCGAFYTVVIPVKEHSFTVYVPVEGEEATCTEPGKEIASCDHGCGTTDTKDVEALGHNWVKDEQNSTAGHLVEVCANNCGETRTTLTGSVVVKENSNTTVILAGNSHDNQYTYEYTINLGQYNGSGPEIVFTRQAENRDVTLDLVEAILDSTEYRDLFPANETLARMRITSFVTGVLTDDNLDPENPDKIWQISFIDKFANTLNSFVNSLNNRGGSAMSFALYNDGTEKVIVANISDLAGAQAAIQGLVEYLMLPDNKYPVINMLGYTDAAASTFALRARAALSTEEYKSFLKSGTISLQALIDGILYEDGFGSETILNGITPNGTIGATAPVSGTPIVGTASAGAYLQTIYLQLGTSSAIEHDGLKMYLTLSDIDALAGYRGMLEQVTGVAEVVTEGGDLKVNLTLPEKVLEAYLAAALATGLEEKEAIAAVEAAAAYEFIYGYLQVITEDDVTVDTLENTLSMLGQNIDLQQYESIFNMAQSVLTDAELHNQDKVISISRDGKATIDALLNAANVDLGSLSALLNVITEYKSGNLEVDIVAHLNKDAEAPAKEFEVAVIDVQNGSNLDKVDFAEVGAARINAMQGTGAVMLLADIEGNLVFNNTTILDLNGKTITGSIKANAPLVIIDSCMDTYLCGGVDGKIEGNVTIIAGNYTADVTKFLAEGYVQKDGTVRNALYHVVKTSTFARAANETVTYVINSDFIDEIDGYLPSVRELAVDIAADLVLNYITAASFSVDGETITAIDLTDVIDLISGGDRVEKIVDELLGCVDVDGGVTYFINALFADLLNFEGIAYAIENDTAIATHTVTTRPWLVTVERIANGDYITASLTYNTDDSVKKEFDLSLVIDGQNAKTAALPLFKELAEIVDANETKVEVALDQPIYDDQIVTVVGTLTANAVADLTLGGSDSDDYATVLGVILAYGNTAKRAAVADAINNADLAALKAVVDGTSVKELFTALKAMSRDVTFAEMATAVGVTVNVGIGEYLDTLYRYVFVGAGKVLEKLEITGMDSKLGGLYNAQTGFYELSKGAARDGNYTHSSGYGVDYDLTLDESGLKVKLFPEISAADTTWTVTVYGNKGTHFTSSKGDWDYGDNEIVITLDADEELTFEYWVDDNRTLTSFKINGENVRSKYPANKEHTISVADFGSEVEIYIASTPTIVPSTKVICDCGDPDCTCKIECHSALYEDLAAILAANPNVWWHLDGHRYLDYVICKGLMVGTSTDPLLFEPSMLMSRSMIVTALYHLEGDPEVTGNPSDYYTDVLDGWWYSDAIVWATNEGLVYGYGNDKFGADDVLTREQLATLFYRFTEYKGKDVDYNGSLDLSGSFTDAGDISTWALTGMEWAYDRGLISGPGNNILLPKGDISRCEFAALLCHWIWGEYDD